MYKVFINDKPICLVDATDNVKLADGDLLLGFTTIHDMQLTLDIFEKETNVKCLYIIHNNVKELFTEFTNGFQKIEAAGGVVYNTKNEVLFIKRFDKWDLPKGKVEQNETIEKAAIREVEEECAVTGLVISVPLSDTFHIYQNNDKRILKITHWFKMNTTASDILKPQTSEGITEAKWFSINNMDAVLNNTYANIKNLLQEVIK
jgi:ADP-ribose pyrophosphatase YjhB (NUDIX family)